MPFIRRRGIPCRKLLASVSPFSRNPGVAFRHPCRFQHDGGPNKRTQKTLPQPATTGSVADGSALFPAEVTELRTQDEHIHCTPIPVVEGVTVEGKDKCADSAESQPGIQKSDEKQPSFREPKDLSQVLSIFLPRGPKKRNDFSHTNPMKWESNLPKSREASAEVSWWHFDPKELAGSPTVAFRSTGELRQLVIDYLQKVEPCFNPTVKEEILLDALQSTFSEDLLRLLETHEQDVADVASWAWILSSTNMDLAVARYVVLAGDVRDSRRGRIPVFVPLQLLRAAQLSAHTLKELIKAILAELQLCLDADNYGGIGWSWVSRVCLVVRLLRHARKVAPECFLDISVVVRHLFSNLYKDQTRTLEIPELHRLTHVFNRFLTLISLAPAKAPFNSYLAQQNAQLALVRLMFAFTPALPLTREGYRALITVQLRHRKTRLERTWAEAKSHSWPPWRKSKSGIEEDLEFPGKESRVIKLLRRMQEAGYTLGEWEKSAGVLGGWDTDGSPTIQTRAILMRQRQPWQLQAPNHNDAKPSEDGPTVWAARIRATRTARESWASFCSWEKTLGSGEAHYEPYFAMMEKLLVGTAAPGSTLERTYRAGDIKESFEDSTDPRQVVYVESSVPSVDEFYQRMLDAGIQPGGTVLAGLLKHSSDLDQGFGYIEDSRWPSITKEVLRHAEQFPSSTISQAVGSVSMLTFAALISLLSKSGPSETMRFQEPGSLDEATRHRRRWSARPVPPMMYAFLLLRAGGVTDIRAWNALLRGASEGVSRFSARDRRAAFSNGWWHILWRSMSLRIHPNLDTFRHQSKLLHRLFTRFAPPVPFKELGALGRMTFVQAVYGRAMPAFLPPNSVRLADTPNSRDLMLLVRTLVSLHDCRALVAVVRWINEHASKFGSAERDEQPGQHATAPQLGDVLCAIRLFLEREIDVSAPSLPGVHVVTSPIYPGPWALQRAQELCQVLAWPSDEELGAFFAQNQRWVEKVGDAARTMKGWYPARVERPL